MAAGCVGCHTDVKNKGPLLAGGRKFKTPFGTSLAQISHRMKFTVLENGVTKTLYAPYEKVLPRTVIIIFRFSLIPPSPK